MSFSDKFTAVGIVTLLDRLGVSVSYTTVSTGVSVTRRAIFNRFVYQIDHRQDALFVMASDATTGIASPARGDKITLAGVEWEIEDVRTDQDGSHELKVWAPELIT